MLSSAVVCVCRNQTYSSARPHAASAECLSDSHTEQLNGVQSLHGGQKKTTGLSHISGEGRSQSWLECCTSCRAKTSCTHDVQVVRMLRGLQDPGPAFHLNKKEGRFGVAPQTHVADLSQSSLHHLLHTFASVATDLLR